MSKLAYICPSLYVKAPTPFSLSQAHTTKSSLQRGTGNKLVRKPDPFEVSDSEFHRCRSSYVIDPQFTYKTVPLAADSFRHCCVAPALWQDNTTVFPVPDIILATEHQSPRLKLLMPCRISCLNICRKLENKSESGVLCPRVHVIRMQLFFQKIAHILKICFRVLAWG